ncbi:TonB-dependent receptor [Elizabethkingia ursingii]|uniref:TonB-dependent receptor n=1 Tax=Elizabethkingia ursingii TaxID=1756150 RepID=UPI000750E09B|nr:TonB-dependent receptor [Elizabethkingia ursingii]KUY26171.1 TonB-dependent receptor [Elizabethkingia ursingii]
MKINFRKPMLAAVITLTTASVYYAQQTQDSTKSKSKDIEEVILKGVTDIAKDRKTPVAVSTVKAAQIVERLGNQELVEILNTTPSVYATKGGGGFGDSGITLRGFESRNIAVMVNGMPVNDMEGGTVYMSNWTGLADVTSTMQVQRGLGSSKLAIASVGGTMNFLTRSADMKQGGVIRLGVGNNDFLKTSFAYNTGKTQNGWSSSFLMSRQAGSTYIQNTDYEAYTYFFALGYQPNKKHNLQFMITSSPQWHDQRTFAPTIANTIKYNPDNDGTPDRTYNSDWGYRTMPDGRRVAIANRSNYYSKPVLQLNWDWTISDKSTLSTVAYMSNGRGGGTGDLGRVGGKGMTGYVDNQGLFDYDKIFAANAAVNVNTAAAGSTLIRRSSINSHNWYGILANFQHKINDNWNFSIGTDDRYYYGYHYQVISDLYGASGYKDNANKNIPNRIVRNTYDYKKLEWNPFGGKQAPMEDRVAYSNDGEVLWYSGFGQVEFSTEKFTAYAQGSISNQGYRRIDEFVNKNGDTQQGQPVARKTDFKNLFGFTIKGGANYNIDNNHNVFANIGYYSKQPFFNSVYPSNQQVVNPALTNEKIFSAELGYGFKSRYVDVNINAYRTQWDDRFITRTFNATAGDVANFSQLQLGNSYFYNALNVGQLHQGVELEAKARPFSNLRLRGMLSVGNWKYKGNANFNIIDVLSNQEVPGATGTINIKDLKVGDAAQTTASIGADYNITKAFSIDANWEYYDKLYAQFNPINFLTAAARDKGVVKLPSYNLFDVGAAYKFTIDQKRSLTLRVNVYNLFNKYYISELSSNIYTTDKIANGPDAGKTYQEAGRVYQGVADGNTGFLGFGRTWSAAATFRF